MMLAAHVVASRKDRVSFDRLAIKGCARGGPVLESAVFEIEVQRTAIFAGGKNALGRGAKERRTQEKQCREKKTPNLEP
jgi:hypothetical protein